MVLIKQIVPTYSDQTPTNQTMIDILAGSWVSSFPSDMNITAGSTAHFDQNVDSRVKEVREIFDFKNKSVCELGPLEAYQTKHLCDAGAHPVVAIEANDIAFIKCLMVKELLDIPAKFLYGSAISHLNENNVVYDVIWASGVLYHQIEPLRLLQLICNRSRSFFIWSHYFSKTECSKIATFEEQHDRTEEISNFSVRYHYKSYIGKGAEFSGGVESGAYWMEKDSILDFVRNQGFELRHYKEQPDAPPGPVMSFFAVKK